MLEELVLWLIYRMEVDPDDLIEEFALDTERDPQAVKGYLQEVFGERED